MGAACDKGLFGWPCDAEIEKMRSDYGFAADAGGQSKVAGDLQARAIEQVVYVPFGQWTQPIALSRETRSKASIGVTGARGALGHPEEVARTGAACRARSGRRFFPVFDSRGLMIAYIIRRLLATIP